MKNINTKFLGFIIVLNAHSAMAQISSEDKISYKKLATNLSQVQEMRVYMADASGTGHQQATQTVMRYLRKLGFKGSYDLIIADTVKATKTTVLKQGLPFYDPTKAGQQCDSQKTICVRTLSEFQADTGAKPLKYGISGADDGYEVPGTYEMKFIGAAELKVEKYIALQPIGWSSHEGIDEVGKEFVQKKLQGLGLAYHDTVEANALAVAGFQQFKASTDPSENIRGENLSYLLTNEHKFDIQTIYGMGLIPNVHNVFGTVAKLASGVRAHAEKEGFALFNRPKLLLTFSTLSEDEWYLSEYQFGSMDSNIQPVPTSNIQLYDIRDADLVAKLSKKMTSPDQVAVIAVGRVPQGIYLKFVEAADLPILVGGKNTIDEAMSMGIPYFNTVQDTSDLSIYTTDADGNGITLYEEQVSAISQVSEKLARGDSSPSSLNSFYPIMVAMFTKDSEYYKLFHARERTDTTKIFIKDKIAVLMSMAFDGDAQ